MAILLALNGYQVLTGQPESGDTDHHHGHENDDPLGWRENARRLGVEERIAFRHFDVQDLPFPDESYDALFLYDTLQHVGDRETALRECLRVMRPNGVTCVIEWTHETIAADEARYGFRIDYIDPAQIVDDEAISVERLKGRLVNFFVLRKAQERA
jgi:SAM-dependent methyltransferase